MKGLEPPRLTAPDPKSGVATNYTTSANIFFSFFVSANIMTFSFLKQENFIFFTFFIFFELQLSFSILYLLLLHL